MKLQNPFRVAFVATLGVGLGLLLIASVQTLSTILLYVGTALFLALGLEPMVSWLIRRRVPRWAAVLVTIVVVLGVFAGVILMVLPIIVEQITQFVVEVTREGNGRAQRASGHGAALTAGVASLVTGVESLGRACSPDSNWSIRPRMLGVKYDLSWRDSAALMWLSSKKFTTPSASA